MMKLQISWLVIKNLSLWSVPLALAGCWLCETKMAANSDKTTKNRRNRRFPLSRDLLNLALLLAFLHVDPDSYLGKWTYKTLKITVKSKRQRNHSSLIWRFFSGFIFWKFFRETEVGHIVDNVMIMCFNDFFAEFMTFSGFLNDMQLVHVFFFFHRYQYV